MTELHMTLLQMVRICRECSKCHFRASGELVFTVYVDPQASLYEPDLWTGQRVGMVLIWN